MISTFIGIEIGKRGLISQQQGLVTIGHNLTNASTEGYSRQRVEIGTMSPLYMPHLNREETPGQIGQGPLIMRISRARDTLLDQRIVAQMGDLGYWNTRNKYILMLEQIYNEPSEVSVRTQMDKFWDSWQELSLHPAELPQRQAVLERAKTLLDAIHTRYQRLSSTRDMVEQDIQMTVNQVNTYIRQIAALNEEIVKVEAMGDNPNDLYDRRDLLVEKLGQLIPVTTDNRDPNEFMVHVDGHVLVQGKIGRTFETDTDPNNNGYTMIRWGDTGTQAFISGGSLGSLFELRDVDIRDEIALLDTLTLTFTDMVNEVHQSAYGLNGKTGVAFFTEQPRVNNVAGNYDRDGDGVYDSTMLHRMTGSNKLNAQDQVGIAGVIRLAGANGPITIEYKPTDTVGDIIRKINNSGSEVTARLTFDGKLELRGTVSDNLANPDFVIRSVEDSGEFLVGYAGILNASGAEGAYAWDRADAATLLSDGASFGVAPIAHPSGWIEITKEIKGDITNIAAGFGVNGRPAEVGNGDAALAIAQLRSSTVMVGQEGTFDEYFAFAVGRIGLKGEQAEKLSETQARIVKNLTDMRDSISGVNIDEELSNMIKFQHGYAAAAKFIQHFDQMLDTIINRMGV